MRAPLLCSLRSPLPRCSSGTTIIVRQPARRRSRAANRSRLPSRARARAAARTNHPSRIHRDLRDRAGSWRRPAPPAHAHQRTWILTGLNWVPVSWKVQSAMYSDAIGRGSAPARWGYARSPRTIRFCFQTRRSPPATCIPRTWAHCLSRLESLPDDARDLSRVRSLVVDEAWAEDAYALAPRMRVTLSIVRIYCVESDRVRSAGRDRRPRVCPVRVRRNGRHGASNGTVVRSPRRPVPTRRRDQRSAMRRRVPETTPISLPDPTASASPSARKRRRRDPVLRTLRGTTRTGREGSKDATKGVGKWQCYGHTDDPNVKGRGIENEKRNDPRRTSEPEKDKNVKAEKTTPRSTTCCVSLVSTRPPTAGSTRSPRGREAG